MMGKRMLALMLALLFALLVFAGCARNPDDVVGMVGETPIYRWYFEYRLRQQLKGYETYAGVDLTQPAYKKQYKEYKQNILSAQVGEAAMKEMARKQGLYNLTAEQEAEIDQKYLDVYNKAIDALMVQYGTDDNGRRKAEQSYNDTLKDAGMTADRMRSVLRDEYVLGLLYDSLGIKHDVSEEEIRAYYDEQVTAQTKALTDNPNAFAENQPDVAIVIPQGYMETARIMLKFTDRQKADLAKAQQSVKQAASEYMLAAKSNGKDSIAATTRKAGLERVSKAYNKILEDAYKQLEKSIEPIREEALKDGFFKIRELRTEDSHKISYYVSAVDPANTGSANTAGSNGTAAADSSANSNTSKSPIEEAYRSAALALKNVGDISPAVRLNDGVCIIYLVNLPGTLPYEEVKTDIDNLLRASLKKKLYFQQDEYGKKANEEGIVKLYTDKL